MRLHSTLITVLAIGTLALTGCENGSGSAAHRTEPQMLSAAGDRPLSAPDIDLNMESFNANIGDTTTGVGDGNATN